MCDALQEVHFIMNLPFAPRTRRCKDGYGSQRIRSHMRMHTDAACAQRDGSRRT